LGRVGEREGKGASVPLMSTISTYSAESLDWRVAFREAGVMPEVFAASAASAASAAWVSVSAAMGVVSGEVKKWGEVCRLLLCGIVSEMVLSVRILVVRGRKKRRWVTVPGRERASI
jgi:hypothetical protein